MLVKENQETRWNQALKIAKGYISDKKKACIVLAAPEPYLTTLERAENTIPEKQKGKLRESIAFAENLAWEKEQLILITDGAGENFSDLIKEIEEKKKDYILHIIGEETENISLKAQAIIPDTQGHPVLSVEIQNHGKEIQENRIVCECQEQDSASSKVLHSIPFSLQKQSRRIEKIVLDNGKENQKIRVFLARQDAFPSDSEITIQIPEKKKAKILLIADTPQPYLMAALLGYAEFIDQKESISVSDILKDTSVYDLVIISKKECPALSEGNFLLWATRSPSIPGLSGEKVSSIAWYSNPLHPLSLHLDFFSLEVQKAWKSFSIEPANILLYGQSIPLIWEGKTLSANYLYVSFGLEDSNFASLASFPIFIHNCIQWALSKKQTQKTSIQVPLSFQSDITPYPSNYQNPAPRTQNIVFKNTLQECLLFSIVCAFLLLCVLVHQ